jgi:putative ABC transport system permease protein
MILLVLVVGLVSGSYPAFYLARLRPVLALRGELKTGKCGPRLRQGLVITQFALSIIMMISTVVAYRQMSYVRAKHLGFNKDQLVVIDINSGGTRRSYQAIKNSIGMLPPVSGVSVSSRVPGDWKGIDQITAIAQGAPPTEAHTMFFMCIDPDFLQTFQMSLVSGRNLSGEMGTDTASVIINETAVRTFGWEDPLGKEIRVPGANYQARVVGVVKDFSFESLHDRIAPLVLGHTNNPVTAIDYFTVRVRAEGMEQTLGELKKIHEQFDQTTPFEYNFLDERLNDFYRTDLRMGEIFGLSAGLTIVIACLGLFGLAAFSAEQRTKEIGVRKVLGASEAQIVFLLSRDVSKLVIIAMLIAAPIAYFFVERWLQAFAYRIDVGWMTFVLVGLGSLLIALLTVGYQAIRAALADPVEALKYE